jgi:hypothetical protein
VSLGNIAPFDLHNAELFVVSPKFDLKAHVTVKDVIVQVLHSLKDKIEEYYVS